MLAPFKWRALPGVEEFARKQLAIPVGWWVGEEGRRQIMDALEMFNHKESI